MIGTSRVGPVTAALTLTLALAATCGGQTPEPQPPRRAQERLAADTTRLACDLYQTLREEEKGNLLLSPYTLARSLAMTCAGSGGETRHQMQHALHLTLPEEQLHAAFRELRRQLAGDGPEGVALSSVTSLWGQSDYGFLAPFLRTAGESYAATVRAVDFKSAPEQARQDINQWLGERMDGRITELLEEGLISHLTRLVLVNASHFHGTWRYGFDPAQTHDATFTRVDGSQVVVPMMGLGAQLGYHRRPGLQVIELPYRGEQVSMLIILPEPDALKAVEESLSPGMIDDLLQSLHTTQVRLRLPRFSCRSGLRLEPALSRLGMPIAFSDDADFSRISGNLELTLEDVVQQVVLTVDEQGTEVSAGGAAVVMKKCGPGLIRVDRPFLILVRDRTTGTILLLGRVTDPSANG
jgi:serpin B